MSLLQERVLVLNKSWQPINTTTVRNAIALLYQDCAQVVEPNSYATFDFESWKDAAEFARATTAKRVLQGNDWSMPLPEVIVLRRYNGFHRQRVKFSRRNIFVRDRNTCQYCANKFRTQELTLDHVLPRSRGGLATWENIVLACQRCNRRKANRTPEEAGLALLRAPFRPRWTPILAIPVGRQRQAWSRFVSERYWNIELQP